MSNNDVAMARAIMQPCLCCRHYDTEQTMCNLFNKHTWPSFTCMYNELTSKTVHNHRLPPTHMVEWEAAAKEVSNEASDLDIAVLGWFKHSDDYYICNVVKFESSKLQKNMNRRRCKT